MGVFKMKSKASYRSRSVAVTAKVSLSVRWRDYAPRRSPADELSTYTTAAELRDLEAMMERYDDAETEEMRSILAAQAEERRFAAHRGPFGSPCG